MNLNEHQIGDKLAGVYGAVKRSLWYPLSLLVGTLVWWLCNRIFQFDPGLVNLLTILSIEATLATSLVQRDQAHQEETIMALLKYMKHTLEALKTLLENVKSNQVDK